MLLLPRAPPPSNIPTQKKISVQLKSCGYVLSLAKAKV